MIPLTLEQIAKATGGTLTSGNGQLQVSSISTDSRAVKRGDLFIALHGEKFDAHDYLAQVAQAGVAAALIHREMPGLSIPAVLVGDTRKALGQLGSFVRDLFKAKAVAIGGSNGKTTTKHLVGSVLSSQLAGSQSPKSFNNDIGVPLTLLGVEPNHDFVVLELGTNHPGELSPLSLMSRPEIAAITSIGPEHLEGFGDLDGVRREEVSLLDGLTKGGLCIANADDAPLPAICRERASRVITFGFANGADFRIGEVDCSLEGIRFCVDGIAEPFYLPLPGKHNAANALVAIIIGREFGLSDAAIRDALANCSRPEMRMQVVKSGSLTILNDAYNANPASMAAALETLAAARVPGRRVAVLGEMRELGDRSEQLHRDLGQLAATSKLDLLICVTGNAKYISEQATQSGMANGQVRFVDDAAMAAGLITSVVKANDTVLLKGSRGVKLEQVSKALLG